jgi:hypothetical protein
VGEVNYDNMLVISQPSENSCVHVMDARWPRYSNQDSDQILLLGEYSRIENVLTEGRAPRPAEFIFGQEPAHTWCYYYQQAERALQSGNWEQIVQIGNQVNQLDLHPHDRIEWTPFLQAYAWKGDAKAFMSAVDKIGKAPFIQKEACHALLTMQETGIQFTSQIQTLTVNELCRGQTELGH